MSLPPPWIDRIFEKLGLVYGNEFLNRWKGLKLTDVKTDWAHELAGFQQLPDAIAWGLQNLPPERPPTVLQFRDLCRKAPAPDLPRLPEPKADPERLKAEVAKLAPLLAKTKKPASGINVDWAHRIVAKHDSGVRVAPAVLRIASEVARAHPIKQGAV
jgi:hypothetical protein